MSSFSLSQDIHIHSLCYCSSSSAMSNVTCYDNGIAAYYSGMTSTGHHPITIHLRGVWDGIGWLDASVWNIDSQKNAPISIVCKKSWDKFPAIKYFQHLKGKSESEVRFQNFSSNEIKKDCTQICCTKWSNVSMTVRKMSVLSCNSLLRKTHVPTQKLKLQWFIYIVFSAQKTAQSCHSW